MTDDMPDLTRAELFADGNRGQYIPQYFAQTVRRDLVSGVTNADWQDLDAGPDWEYYWDAWDRVTNNATLTHSTLGQCYLWHDGDLWIVPQADALAHLDRIAAEQRRLHGDAVIAAMDQLARWDEDDQTPGEYRG